jgi:hypothetical protein
MRHKLLLLKVLLLVLSSKSLRCQDFRVTSNLCGVLAGYLCLRKWAANYCDQVRSCFCCVLECDSCPLCLSSESPTFFTLNSCGGVLLKYSFVIVNWIFVAYFIGIHFGWTQQLHLTPGTIILLRGVFTSRPVFTSQCEVGRVNIVSHQQVINKYLSPWLCKIYKCTSDFCETTYSLQGISKWIFNECLEPVK